MAAAAPEQVTALAAEIRSLKADLANSGLKSDAVNQHPEVLAKVKALKDLKATLAEDDPNRDEAFFARQKVERDEAHKQEKALAQAQRQELLAAEKRANRPLVQRKIFHLFKFAGSGSNFRYEPPARLNPEQTGFGEGTDPQPPVYVTEKWDGTTMQATSTHIFKRIDLRGGRGRTSLSVADRYDLRLLAWRGEDTAGQWRGLDFVEADKLVAEAVTRYLPCFAALDDGICVYFEVVHTDINATFKGVPGFADIRVFDSSSKEGKDGGSFLPFETTIDVASRARLPLVGWRLMEQLDPNLMWCELEQAAHKCYDTVQAPLEGYVIREGGGGGRIAKARVEHILAVPVVSISVDTAMLSEAAADEQAGCPHKNVAMSLGLSMAYLRLVGLPC